MDSIWRVCVARARARWIALDSDWQSVALGVGIVVIVGLLEPSIP